MLGVLACRRGAAAAGEAAAGDPGHVRLVHVGRVLLQRVSAGCRTLGGLGLLCIQLRVFCKLSAGPARAFMGWFWVFKLKYLMEQRGHLVPAVTVQLHE